MIGDARIERDLPRILEDIGTGPTPDYSDSILARTASIPQRAGWTFPDRWLPVRTFRGRMVATPRLPWRTVGVIALLALALAATAMIVGRQQRRLPPPFGPAGNGLIAYADFDGDIYVGDPVTRTTTAIVTGQLGGAVLEESELEFSPDGSRIMFRRFHLRPHEAADIFTVRPDGSELRVIAHQQWSEFGFGPLAWTLDSSFVVVDQRAFDAAGTANPRDLVPPVGHPHVLRSPVGDRVLLAPDSQRPNSLFVMDAGGSNTRALIDPSRGDITYFDIWEPAWSSDGSRIAFTAALGEVGACGGAPCAHERRVFVMSADGTNLHRLTGSGGPVIDGAVASEEHFAWSPDGSQIAFDRTFCWVSTSEPQRCDEPARQVRPVIVDVETGVEHEIDTANPAFGGYEQAPARWSWSPDGRSLLFLPTRYLVTVDVDTAQMNTLPWRVYSPPTWQRIAVE